MTQADHRETRRPTSRQRRNTPAVHARALPLQVPRLTHLAVIGFALLGFIVALAGIFPFGTGISRDSVEYLSAARGQIAGEGLVSFDGQPFDLWPPLYPIVLAISGWVSGQDPFVAGGWLNAALYGLAIYLMGNYLRSAIPARPLWGVMAAILVFISPAFFGLSINLLSDLLFINLVLLFLTVASHWLVRPTTLRLLLMAILAGASIVTRYIGFELALIGLGLVLLKKDGWMQKVRNGIAFGLVAGFPLAAWVVRNLVVSGTLLGPRAAARRSLAENWLAMGNELRGWIVPQDASISDRWIDAFIVAIFVLAIVVVVRELRRPKHIRPEMAGLLLSYSLAYIPLLLLSASLTDVTTIDLRLSMPAYPGFILAICLVLDFVLAQLIGLKSWRLAFAAGVLIAWWGFYGAQRSLSIVLESRIQGAAIYNYLNTREFNLSGVTQYLRSNPLPQDGTIYSNYATAVYLFSGRRAVFSPNSHHPFDDEILYSVEEYLDEWPERTPAYLVWFNAGSFTHYHSPEALGSVYRLIPLYESADGGIYQVELP